MRPDLDGNQIMEILGVGPSHVVGQAYDHLLERRIDAGRLGPDRAREELLAWWASGPAKAPPQRGLRPCPPSPGGGGRV